MESIRKFNKEFWFSLCVVDNYSKYACVVPLKDKTGITTTNVFRKILDESYRTPNKIWIEKGSELYNRSMKSFLLNSDIQMYSRDKGKSVIAERFIRTLKNKIDKYMTAISKICILTN